MSEVILIGDRAVGKTQSVRKLLEPPKGKITISNITASAVSSSATKDLLEQKLSIEAMLKRPRRLDVGWVDTPGGWNEMEWQNSPEISLLFDKYKANLSKARALVLLLKPYRTAGKVKIYDRKIVIDNEVVTESQWCRRFDRWSHFISATCQQVSQINICISKADLFCDVDVQANIIENQGWLQQSNYIYQEFFPSNNSLFKKSLQRLPSGSVRFFIISIYNRTLLEMPWLSLATNL